MVCRMGCCGTWPGGGLVGADPVIGFNYLGRLGGAAELSDELWRVCPEGLSSAAGAAAAIPVPLAHTVELNAATLDTEAGPRLQAAWSWASSRLEEAQVRRLGELWFEALAGICAHVGWWGWVDALGSGSCPA